MTNTTPEWKFGASISTQLTLDAQTCSTDRTALLPVQPVIVGCAALRQADLVNLAGYRL